MGQVSTRLDDSPQIYLRDQSRFALQSIKITDTHGAEVLSINIKDVPGGRVAATSEAKRPLEFIQDPEKVASDNLEILLKLRRIDELTLHFKGVVLGGPANGQPEVKPALTGLTFIHAANLKEAKRLLTTDFNADPNLHKHKNVTYVGDYSGGSLFEWHWTWRPLNDVQPITPTGYRSFCSVSSLESRLTTVRRIFPTGKQLHYVGLGLVLDLSMTMPGVSPQRRPGKLSVPPDPSEPRLQSVPESPERSAIASGSNAEIPREYPPMPPLEPIHLSNPRDDELLVKEIEDGPLFRSRIIALEKKTVALKAKTKKIISRADAVLDAQNAYYEADRRWYESLQQLASTNSKAAQPLLVGYLDASYLQTQKFHRKKVAHLQILVNELRRIYDYDIKAAEAKKRAWEEESQDYYHSMTKYLARTEFPSASKQKEKDSKYQNRRKDHELKRFDYWSYMNDLTGGRKEQEILHHLTAYMDSQMNTLTEGTKAELDLKPGLDALLQQVEEASREFKLMRTEREQRRRDIEMGKNLGGEAWQLDTNPGGTAPFAEGTFQAIENVLLDPQTPSGTTSSISRGQWSSDVEDEEKVDPLRRKKEGILFALSRPANHNDPKVMPKLNWHKYWVVLDKGQLWEYTNWKRSSELHNDSIHLNAATVREAQNQERRFCFELVTPKFKRVYQAMSNEDMESWIQAIRNAIESALDGSGTSLDLLQAKSPGQNKRNPIGDMFSSKSGKDKRTLSGSQERRDLLTGGGDKTSGTSKTHAPNILAKVRNVDPSNSICADCGSTSKVEWCSINLAVVLCIECSGVHRSLGSHISKMRSLTLDTNSFTPNLLSMLRLLPNAVSNLVWEHTLNPSHPKPTAQSSHEARQAYITAKYVHRSFVDHLPPSTTANELLTKSIATGDLKSVLWALAKKANPNSRSSTPPPIVLALLLDDKLANTLSKSDSGSSNGSLQSKEPPKFPFAELLILNGATPVDPKTISPEANGLSDTAKRYLQEKVDRILQNVHSPPTQHSLPSKSGSIGGNSVGTLSSQSGGTSSIGGDLNRTVSKLQKRLSSGGKNLRTQLTSSQDKDRDT